MSTLPAYVHTDAAQISEAASIVEAYGEMAKRNIKSMPVTSAGELVGIIYKHHIQGILDCTTDADALKVRDFMQKKFQFVETADSLDDIAKVMIKNRISRLPVVGSAKKMDFVGVVTSTDVVLTKTE